MGASEFGCEAYGKTAKEAFAAAVEEARYESGHGGYTGTIAEKHDFKLITVPEGVDPMVHADKLMADDDKRISDKWGPAGCVELPSTKPNLKRFYFFGYASS